MITICQITIWATHPECDFREQGNWFTWLHLQCNFVTLDNSLWGEPPSRLRHQTAGEGDIEDRV